MLQEDVMSLSPLRFLHAADLYLDAPLCRVSAAHNAVAHEVREAIENATRWAFERVIDEAIERKVDFVILAGNTFVEADQSLTTRIALLDAFDELAEHDIRVFVVPGPADPPAAWRAIPDLPDNVTVFFDRDSEPVAVLRDGKVIATVAASASVPTGAAPNQLPAQALRSESTRRAPFTVILLTQAEAGELNAQTNEVSGDSADALARAAADYVSLCTGESRRTVALKSGLAHHPGATQGLSPRQSGPRGCTRIDVEPDETIRCEFVPTATVVWDQRETEFDASTTELELSERMRQFTSEQGDVSRASVRIVQWTLKGDGPLWDSLWNDETRRRFLECHRERTSGEQSVAVVHNLRLVHSSGSTTADDMPAADFFQAIERETRFPHETLEQCLQEAALQDPEWTRRLRTLIPHLDHEAVMARAHQLGASWFRATAGEGRTA
jgi:DNA repair exonuclease SbcCD nuclease subunit